MSCEVYQFEANINVIQSFSAVKADIDAAIAAELNGAEQCEFVNGFTPDPLWPGMKVPNWEQVSAVANSQMEGVKLAFQETIDTLSNLGIPEPETPEIPGLGISFEDMFPIDYAALIPSIDITALKAALSGIIPDPVFGNITSPAQEIQDCIETAMYNYMISMCSIIIVPVMAVIDLVKDADIGDILPEFGADMSPPAGSPPFGGFPAFPSFDGMDFDEINNLSIPFTPLPDFKLNMSFGPTEAAPTYEIMQAIKNFTMGFAVSCLQLILNFWEEIKKWAEAVMSLPDLFSLPPSLPIPIIIGKLVED